MFLSDTDSSSKFRFSEEVQENAWTLSLEVDLNKSVSRWLEQDLPRERYTGETPELTPSVLRVPPSPSCCLTGGYQADHFKSQRFQGN